MIKLANQLLLQSTALEPTLQETVRHMQEHYAKTGAFMSNDLARVLGDPVKGVGLRADFDKEVRKILGQS